MICSRIDPQTKIPEGAEAFVTAVTDDTAEFIKAATTWPDQPEEQEGKPYSTDTDSDRNPWR